MRVLWLALSALALAGAFERRAAEQPDDSLDDLLQRAGSGGLDSSNLQEAMKAMMGGGGAGGIDLAKMMEEMGGSELMQQLQQAMADPETQSQMLKFAEKMQQTMMENPKLQELTKQFEGMDLEGGIAGALEKLQDNPALKEMAEQFKSGGGLGAGDMAKAMELGQKAMASLLSDPEQAAKLQEAVAQMMNPEAMAAMAEQFGSLMRGEGSNDMAQMMAKLGLGGKGATAEEDDEVFSGNPWDNKDEM